MNGRQEAAEKNAQQVGVLARELYERVAMCFEHFGAIGRWLESANRSFNEAVASFEARVLPAGRKLEALGVAVDARRKLEALEAVEAQPRMMSRGAGA